MDVWANWAEVSAFLFCQPEHLLRVTAGMRAADVGWREAASGWTGTKPVFTPIMSAWVPGQRSGKVGRLDSTYKTLEQFPHSRMRSVIRRPG
ncbi:hypothetical protein DPEC_G00328210 [Dallia pectoralis]|uniref:Uncharacterized protein n=1 Tax=Dallia pectoralis TaxID=75939 RepID=A0ACC2F8L0_DALPE|nr:hypothetical protein DPEC_G00328210 [Dallia pectoralis]